MLLPHFRVSLFVPGDRVLVAVSGGPDSLSLLHCLWQHGLALGLESVEAAHLDHGLRGDESAAEAAWVAAWCAERGIPCYLGLAALGETARKGSKQSAARTARYAFLEKIAAQISASAIATAHTQDDQIETVLMNVLRGTGLDGLRGIPPRRGLFVRPMLDVSRADVEAYCAMHSLTPRHDPSNFSPDTYTRNRIRLELLPQLERDYHPGVRQSLLRLSEITKRDSEYLQTQAKAALAQATQDRDFHQITLDRFALAALHPALLRHTLRAALSEMRGTGEGLTYAHLEQISDAITAGNRQTFGLNLPVPKGTVRVTQEIVTVTLDRVPMPAADTIVSLPVPGIACRSENNRQVQASFDPLPHSVTLDAETVQLATLAVRSWQPGDRIDPLGMVGRHKKVADIFSDAKVPRSERNRVPIVLDANGLLWVAGHCVSERAKVTPETRRVLYLVCT